MLGSTRSVLAWDATRDTTNQSPSNLNPDLYFSSLSIEHGLSHSRVDAMVQDDDGFIWFGTYDGLNRYDGYNFLSFKHNRDDANSLSNNLINSLFKDRDGMIWIGTAGSGVDKFDPTTETFTHYRHDPNNANSLSGNIITENSIIQDSAGYIWVATKSKGLNRLDPRTEIFIHFRHNPDDPNSLGSDKTHTVYEDANSGLLWVGTRDAGLNSINLKAHKITRYPHAPDNPNSLSGNDVSSISGNNKTLWIATRKTGLNSFSLETETFTHYQIFPDDLDTQDINDLNVIFKDSTGILWIGTSGGGLLRFDPASQLFSSYKRNTLAPQGRLPNDWVKSIFEDKSGLFFVGTSGGGISKFDGRPPKFTHFKPEPGNSDSLNDTYVLSVFEDSTGNLWVGNDRVANKIDRKTGKFTFYKNNPNNSHSISTGSITAVHEDENGTLWFATHNGGLNRYNPKTGQFKSYWADPDHRDSVKNIFLTLYRDASGIFWIGTLGNGLNRFDPETKQFQFYLHDPNDPQSLSDNYVYAIFADHEGILWLGTKHGGLNRFDPKTRQIKRYQHNPNIPNSVGGSNVTSIYEDKHRTLWIGTSGGLSKFDRNTETFSHYTEKQGLPNNQVQGILADEAGNLWLSTYRGLSKFDPKAETFRNYTHHDGLQSNIFNRFGVHHKSQSGEMFFGGINGFNAFYPDQIKDNPFVPPVMLTEFQLFNKAVVIGGNSPLQKPISQTEKLTLSHQQNIFSLSFSALDFMAPEINKYRYKLEGFEQQWIETNSKRRYATYTNLAPGDYRFRVQGSSRDGIWNRTGVALDISIIPPWWETSWFRLLATVLFLVFLIGFSLRQQQQTRRRECLLKDRVKDRTHDLVLLNEKLADSSRDKSDLLIELQRVNDDQKSFSYSVSHDLRQPLRAINGFSEALLEDYYDSFDEMGRDYLGRIRNASMRMGELINSLLILSRLSRQAMDKKIVLLDKIAHSEIKNLPDRNQRKHTKFIVQKDMQVKGDPGLLRVMLTNLIANAWKYTQGKDQTKIEFGVTLEEGQQVFYIRDNGVGFDMQFSDKLFGEFQRLHADRDYEGIGIGLATVKRIIVRHGGKIWAESKVNEGATFFFTLN